MGTEIMGKCFELLARCSKLLVQDCYRNKRHFSHKFSTLSDVFALYFDYVVPVVNPS